MINDFFNILLPQGCLALFILIQFLLSMFVSPRAYKYSRLISSVGISLSIVLLTTVQVEPIYTGIRGALISDSYTQLFHFIILLCGFFVVLLTRNAMNKSKQNSYTFHGLLLTALFGAMNIVSANDFLTMFISVELLSFPTYFLIASDRGYYSKEAAFKYLITSAVSTGVFLFGVSYMYGMTTSFNLTEIYKYTAEAEPSIMYSFAGIMIILGLISKLAVFPFANWVVDVYKGTETSVLAYLSTVPKVAMFGIVCRLLVFPLSGSFELVFVIALLSVVTALWANTYAIRENNVKCILACSSAANASYVLLTASLVSVYNLSAVIFYIICYVLMNLAVFSFLNIAELNGIGMKVRDFQGLFKHNHGVVFAYVISVIGLAGIPITSGFIAKIYLFSAIANSGLIFIPVLVVLMMFTVLALYYYLKLIRPLFEDSTKEIPALLLKTMYSQKFVLYICAGVTVLIGVCPEKLVEICRFIAYNI